MRSCSLLLARTFPIMMVDPAGGGETSAPASSSAFTHRVWSDTFDRRGHA